MPATCPSPRRKAGAAFRPCLLYTSLGEPSTAAYGREELVAEFSAALVGLGLGVSSGIRAENVAYLKAWLRELREKPVFIFSVLSDVQQVVRFFEEELCMRLFDTAPAENGA